MRSRPLIAVLLGAMLWHAPAHATESAEAEARTLFTQANQHIQDGDFPGALGLLQRAYALFPSVKILLNIGTMLRQLGRNAEAADAYAAYLRDPGADPTRKVEVGPLLAALEAQVGRLRVVVDGGAATVRIDGKAAGPPASEVMVHVEPGAHAVIAEREGFSPVQVDVQARAGSETTVPVRLAPANAPPPPPPPKQKPQLPPPPQPVPPAPASTAHRAAAITTTVLGAVGLVSGVPLALIARSQWNTLRSHCRVPGSPPMACNPEDAHLQTSAGQLADGATAAFVIGGAAAAAATVLWITAPRKSPTAVRFTPVVSPQGAAAIVEGRF